MIGRGIAWIFAPLGWEIGNRQWQLSPAGGKRELVGTFGILYGFAEVAEDGAEVWGTLASSMTAVAAYSFLVFNLCAPLLAAWVRSSGDEQCKWFWFAIGYQTLGLCGVLMRIPVRQPPYRRRFHDWPLWQRFLYWRIYVSAPAPYKESATLNVNISSVRAKKAKHK